MLLPKDLVVQKTHSIDLGLINLPRGQYKARAQNNALRTRGLQIAAFNKDQKIYDYRFNIHYLVTVHTVKYVAVKLLQ